MRNCWMIWLENDLYLDSSFGFDFERTRLFVIVCLK